jgi:hypothetical protein
LSLISGDPSFSQNLSDLIHIRKTGNHFRISFPSTSEGPSNWLRNRRREKAAPFYAIGQCLRHLKNHRRFHYGISFDVPFHFLPAWRKSRIAFANVKGCGGHPGTNIAGPIRSKKLLLSSDDPSYSPPEIAHAPTATTKRGSGMASQAICKASCMFLVNGPVATSASACLGDATHSIPNRWISKFTFAAALSSNSHPLHPPADTCRIFNERPKIFVNAAEALI